MVIMPSSWLLTWIPKCSSSLNWEAVDSLEYLYMKILDSLLAGGGGAREDSETSDEK